MSFGLAHGRTLETGKWLIGEGALPPMPDDALSDPQGCRVDPREWFDNPSAPFDIEIGSGKGSFLVDVCGRVPERNFLGIEWAGEFARYSADRFRRHQLEHVRMLHTDATEFLHWRMGSEICTTMHLYFSDPWPKTRHHKRRVVRDRFLEDVHRVLRPDGTLRIVTDHDGYWEWMQEHFARYCDSDDQSNRFARETWSESADQAGTDELVGTNFERKYRREGRSFHSAVLRKV
jgi:tRNA (guanine-N7-)-methyltransferase